MNERASFEDEPLELARILYFTQVKIQRGRELLERLKPRPGHVLLDMTIARLLWGAVSTADGARAVAEGGGFIGADPLIRFLAESSVGLQYLLIQEDPDAAAVHTFMADLRNYHRRLDLLDEFTPSEREAPTLPPVEEALEALQTHLVEDAGEDPEEMDALFKRAVHTASDHWHWSGGGPGGMIKPLWEATELDPSWRARFHAAHLGQWKYTSNRAHPTPRWEDSELLVVPDPGEFDFRDPLERDEQAAAARLLMVRLYLKEIVRAVAEFYGFELHGSTPNEIITWVAGLDLDPYDPTARREGDEGDRG